MRLERYTVAALSDPEDIKIPEDTMLSDVVIKAVRF